MLLRVLNAIGVPARNSLTVLGSTNCPASKMATASQSHRGLLPNTELSPSDTQCADSWTMLSTPASKDHTEGRFGERMWTRELPMINPVVYDGIVAAVPLTALRNDARSA